MVMIHRWGAPIGEWKYFAKSDKPVLYPYERTAHWHLSLSNPLYATGGHNIDKLEALLYKPRTMQKHTYMASNVVNQWLINYEPSLISETITLTIM